jgi:hypothetical protein
MAYFSHAFKKTFVATKNGDGATNGISDLTGVQLGTDPANVLAPGEITFIDPKTFQVTPIPATDCCEFILGGGSFMSNDKIGPFHGGYTESNKSKTIKGKYVSRLYRAPGNLPSNYITHVGLTPWTDANAPDSSNPGETAGTCCKQFLCGETYYLRLDVKGSPVMRYLDRNGYLTLEGYTGCCADDDVAPSPVDPGIVMLAWANQLIEDTLVNPFVFPIITWSDDNGATWTYYYPDSVDTTTLGALPATVNAFENFSDFTPSVYADGMCAGLTLNGAYYETKFQNCTFQPSDFYELEPVRVYASEVDITGSPCEFEGLCVGVQCYGLQSNGVGETVVRDVIMSESYRQNFLATDLRIREITQGDSLVTAAGIDRNDIYDRVYLQHNIPRLYNPTGTFDNDQYLLEIVVPAGDTTVFNALSTWVTACESDCLIEDLGDPTACAVADPAIPLPALS